jgi:hypothetical protein
VFMTEFSMETDDAADAGPSAIIMQRGEKK